MHVACADLAKGCPAMSSRFLLFAALLAALPAAADTATDPIVAVVRVPKPWYASRALVVDKMRDTVPQYARLPGLAFKAFSFERASGDYGGLYHWRDEASARRFFDAAWFARVKAERGVDARVSYYEAPLTVDNTPGGTRADGVSVTAANAATNDPMLPLSTPPGSPPPRPAASTSVATLVLVANAAKAPRERIVAEFHKAAPTYRAVPGLLRKHFVVADGGASFGGLYLWKDEASARAWFDDAWRERVRRSYGADARIEWFDTPILLPTRDDTNAIAASAMIVAPAAR